jgi:hypothetical protein
MKIAYAMCSTGFSRLDSGNLCFLPKNKIYKEVGYVSKEIANGIGEFSANPTITLNLDISYSWYGFIINFRNCKPLEFTIKTYDNDTLVDNVVITNVDSLNWTDYNRYGSANKVVIEFTKVEPYARVSIDYVGIGDATDYELSKDDMFDTPTVTMEDKLKSITVQKQSYKPGTDKKELVSEKITVNSNNNIVKVDFSAPSHGYTAITDASNVTVTVVESGAYYCMLKFDGLTDKDTTLTYTVSGYEYVVDTKGLTHRYNSNGTKTVNWNNPLVDNTEAASLLDDWLANYYLGAVDYSISWRGDPSVDAGDLFNLIKTNSSTAKIKAYQNELTFNGAWSGKLSARKVVE